MIRNLLLVSCLALPSLADACSCPPGKKLTYAETLAKAKASAAPLLEIEGEVIETVRFVRSVEEIEPGLVVEDAQPELRVLVRKGDGDVLPGTVVHLIGQDGLNCNARLGGFKPTEKHRFLLGRNYKDLAKFDLRDCGTYSERIE